MVFQVFSIILYYLHYLLSLLHASYRIVAVIISDYCGASDRPSMVGMGETMVCVSRGLVCLPIWPYLATGKLWVNFDLDAHETSTEKNEAAHRSLTLRSLFINHHVHTPSIIDL